MHWWEFLLWAWLNVFLYRLYSKRKERIKEQKDKKENQLTKAKNQARRRHAMLCEGRLRGWAAQVGFTFNCTWTARTCQAKRIMQSYGRAWGGWYEALGGSDEADVGGEGDNRQGFNARTPGGQIEEVTWSDCALADFEGSPLPQPFKVITFPAFSSKQTWYCNTFYVSWISSPAMGKQSRIHSIHHMAKFCLKKPL